MAEKLTLSGKPPEESDLRKLAACIQPDEGHLFSPEDTLRLMEGFLLLTETVSSLLDECDLKEEIFNQMIQQERNRDDTYREIYVLLETMICGVPCRSMKEIHLESDYITLL